MLQSCIIDGHFFEGGEGIAVKVKVLCTRLCCSKSNCSDGNSNRQPAKVNLYAIVMITGLELQFILNRKIIR